MRLLRALAIVGAGLFAYLALIPGGLVLASLDPGCSGAGCGRSTLGSAALAIVYALAFLALVASAASFVWLAIEPHSARASQRVVRVLGVTAIAAGLAMFAVFAIGSPVAAAVIAVIGVVCFTLLRRRARDAGGAPEADSESEERASSNGHGPRLDRLPKV